MTAAIDFQKYELKMREIEGQKQVYDMLRKKYIYLTPEELVRQKLIHYLVNEQRYPKAMIKVEGGMKYHQMQKRSDVLVFDGNGQPFLVVECKSFKTKLDQNVLKQVSIYNQHYKAPYIMVTNGVFSYIFEINFELQSYIPLNNLPDYPVL